MYLEEQPNTAIFIGILLAWFTLFFFPAYYNGKLMQEIFVSKRWNPTAGMIIGVLIALVLGVLGLFIVIRIHARVVTRSRKYPFYRGGPEQLEVRWTYGIKNMTVLLNNVELGQIAGLQEAKKGKLFRLADGSDLLVRIGLADDWLVNPDPLPIVELQGKPLPGSTNHPRVTIERTSKLFLIGGIGTILHSLIFFNSDSDFANWGFLVGVAAIITSIYLRRRSRIALEVGYIIAIVSVIDAFQGIGMHRASLESIWDVIEAILFAWGLRSAGSALTTLKKEDVREIERGSIIEQHLSTHREDKTEIVRPLIAKKIVRKTKTKTTQKTDTLKKSSATSKKSTPKKGTKTARRKNTS